MSVLRPSTFASLLRPQARLFSSGSIFTHVPAAPADPILGTTLAWRADPSPKKMNLGVGAYRTEEGKPYVFQVVRKVETMMLQQNLDKEYLPIDGLADLVTGSQKLILGDAGKALAENRVATLQALSGTGSLRIGAEFIRRFRPGATVYLSAPTWGNHHNIFRDAGVEFKEYPYFDAAKLTLNLEGMLDCLRSAPQGSVVLLHVCAHNPTGVDPSLPQWQQIAQVMKERSLLPFFDCAYQGFATGSLLNDAASVRLFADLGFEMLVSQSYAKNFGLYGERVGAFSVVCGSSSVSSSVLSQLKAIARPMYSNPPLHGARIVGTVLKDQGLFNEWQTELSAVSGRIQEMRRLLLAALKDRNTPGDWSHITSQIGMFSYTGLTPTQVDLMIGKHHIYMLRNGRISMAGINKSNVDYLAAAMHDAVTTTK